MLLVIAEETNEEELPTWDAFYQKMSHLSIEKLPCENYLFKDYRLESGIAMWILALMTSGRNPRNIHTGKPFHKKLFGKSGF